MINASPVFLFFLNFSFGGDTLMDTITSVKEYMDLDLFLVTVVMCDSVDQVDLLHRPTLYPQSVMKMRTNALLRQLGVKRYMVNGQSHTIERFLKHMDDIQKRGSVQSRQVIKEFLDRNFYPPGEDVVEENISKELQEQTLHLVNVTNTRLKELLCALHKRWEMLYKRTVQKGYMSTLIPLPHPFVVPGGRFREMYYWDSWFVLEGLIASGLKEPSLNMLKNFIYLIEEYEFIPNGTRKYYLNRSQPPFFCLMLESMLKFKDKEIDDLVLGKGLDMAMRELKYFEREKQKTFLFGEEKKEMFFYLVHSDYPRIESFREDLNTYREARHFYKEYTAATLQDRIFSSLKSAAESGIDFSSRWFEDGMNMHTINTINKVPVDLNTLICRNMQIIAMLLRMRSDPRAQEYMQKADALKDLINTVLWNAEKGCWNDYNTSTQRYVSDRFYPSNLYPLFFGIEPPNSSAYGVILLNKHEIFGYVSGVPSSGDVSDKKTGQQWDFPNVWAPHNYLFQQYFENVLKEPQMAFHIAKCFFKSVLINYEEKKCFYEKYTASNNGDHGGGGEYKTQDGFGWTNGATICFIKEYGDRLMDTFDHKASYQSIQSRLEEKILQDMKSKKFEPTGDNKLPNIKEHEKEALLAPATS
ncbi:hypothetical protein VCUG_00974 [Vavraia culicis subsp. floridensis]|uniref:Trehalase n=1 Tax=Vavraia culicis (isolate floridensis) TaxID=948595 RepID=L2GW70_VAVCU|nr:uncharacterized protein VCUG_00974 [Vavraia culicis subsp. floridensis]ELA47543.1 hypothetical protein VCUG_00974 [Vavraia culicis subsp. floridensis]